MGAVPAAGVAKLCCWKAEVSSGARRRLRDLLRLHGRTGWGMLRGDEAVLAGVDREETSGRLEGWMERRK